MTKILSWIGANYPLLISVLLCIVILSFLLPVSPFEWFDIPLYFLLAKADSQNLNPVTILRSAYPKDLGFHWPGLIYFRPVSRIFTAIFYKFFNTHFIYYTFTDAILFIGIVINIYLIGLVYENKFVGFLSTLFFLLNPQVYIVTNVVAQYALMGVLWYTSAMLMFILLFRHGKLRYLLLSIMFSFLAFGTKESAYYLLCVFILMNLLYRCDERIKKRYRYPLIIFAVFSIALFFYTPFMRLQTNPMGWLNACIVRVLPHLKDYGKQIYGTVGLFWFLILFFGIIRRSRERYIYCIWSLVAFIPILFYWIVSSGYLFDFYIACSLLGGSAIYALVRSLVKRNKGCRLFNNLKSIFIGLFLISFFMYSFISMKKYAVGFSQWRKANNQTFKHDIDALVQKTCIGENVIVPRGKERYYQLMAELLGRQDLRVFALDSSNINDSLIFGQNLLGNDRFQAEIKKWNGMPGVNAAILSSDKSSSGNDVCVHLSLEKELSGEYYNLCVNCPLEANRNYIFGGEVNVSNMNGNVEVVNCIVNRKCSVTPILSSNSSWQYFSVVIREGVNSEKAFSCIRFNATKGNICVRNIFLKEIKYRLVGNWQ
jgi:hypothetical protein